VPRAGDRRAAFELFLIGAGFLVLLFVLSHGLAGDDLVRYDDAEQLIHHGHLTSSRFSLVGPVLSIPLLLLGELVKSPAWWAARFNIVVVACGLATAFAATRRSVDAGFFRRLVLVLLFASFLTDRLRDYGTEVVTGTLVALGTLLVVSRRRPVLGWGAIVLGVVNTPAALGGLALVAAWLAVRERRLRHLLAPAAALVLVGLEAWIRRGSPFTTGYEGDHGVATILPYSGRSGFSYPFVLGLASILFSFGRGLLYFTPGVFLWLGRRTRALVPGAAAATAWLLFLAGLVLVYAKWWAWYGGNSWGPRYFVFAAVPASLFLASRLSAAGDSVLGDALTLGVLALSSWVAVTGALENGWRLGFCAQGDYQTEYVCWYTPDYSGLWWPVIRHPPLNGHTATAAAFCGVVFVYLATPVAGRLGRALAPLPRRLAYGWRL
jgi:hypothetical protein